MFFSAADKGEMVSAASVAVAMLQACARTQGTCCTAAFLLDAVLG
jgi:hypothetical protein